MTTPVTLVDEEPVRVGRIEFVNCFPLYHHFAAELAARGYTAMVVPGTPARLNAMLAAGDIDVALPSSIAFARAVDRLVLLPHVSISSHGAVDSIQLLLRRPLPELRRVAVTAKSATSVSLLRVLCRSWGLEPQFVVHDGPLAAALEGADAVLLIGDEALRALRLGVCREHVDLGEEWRRLTGLPMVYAVCAARRDVFARRPAAIRAVGEALLASRDACAADPAGTAAAAAQLYDFSQAYLAGYFDRLRFGFGDEFRAGLQEFLRRAHEAGELDVVPDVVALLEETR